MPEAKPAMDDALIAAARSGDQHAFEQLAEPLRHALQVHCYRMLGSPEDAEDAVQETYVRAWTRLGSFAHRGSFRAWMYGIATHACLDALRRRKARAWPADLSGPADPHRVPEPPVELPWLQPYPDALLALAGPEAAEPEAAVTTKETIELAFLAAIQRLPARQRAVLILRDVLEWSAKETASVLATTPAAVNSALQRAHATLAGHLSSDRDEWRGSPRAAEKVLLDRLVEAWQRSDVDTIVSLLRTDARMVMPPRLAWFSGKDAVETFLREHVFAGEMATGWLSAATAANRQPAFALYWREPGGDAHQAFAIGVLDVVDDAIAELALFTEPALFRHFALPPVR